MTPWALSSTSSPGGTLPARARLAADSQIRRDRRPCGSLEPALRSQARLKRRTRVKATRAPILACRSAAAPAIRARRTWICLGAIACAPVSPPPVPTRRAGRTGPESAENPPGGPGRSDGKRTGPALRNDVANLLMGRAGMDGCSCWTPSRVATPSRRATRISAAQRQRLLHPREGRDHPRSGAARSFGATVNADRAPKS